jgi:hypothetical protein
MVLTGAVSMSTDGIDIHTWQMKIPFKEEGASKAKEVPVTFSVWDFAGQGKYIYYTYFYTFITKTHTNTQTHKIIILIKHEQQNFI